MTSRELTQTGESLPQRVSADLGAAFARAGLAEHAPPSLAPRSAVVSALRPDRRSGRSLAIGVGLAAGLTGIAAGAFVIRPPGPPAPRVAAAPTLPQTASLDTLPPPSVQMTDPVLPAEAPPAAAPVRPLLRQSAPRAGIRAARVSPPGRVVEHQAVEAPLCPTGEGCRAAVLDADRRLRDTYARAVRLGVPNYVLVEYRDRWADLRQDASDHPADLVRSYGALARELRQETAEARGGGEHLGRKTQPHFTLRTIVPWW